MSLAFIAAMPAARSRPAGPTSLDALQIQYVSTGRGLRPSPQRAQQLENGGKLEAAGLQEANLPGFFAVVGRRDAETALPQREQGGIVFDRRIAERAVDRLAADTLALELAADASAAVAGRLLRHKRMGKALVRQQAACGQLVEHGSDFVAW